MSQLGEVGSFCPYEDCPAYGQVDKGNVMCYGKSRQGQQGYQCKMCQRTFNAHSGRLFYRRKHSEADILECLALLAEGVRISRTKGIKEDTVLAWLRQAASHAAQVEAILLNDYRIGPAQIDGLWTSVGCKESKKRRAVAC